MAETIFALSTVMGKSGVAVFRISGDKALDALELLSVKNLKDRHATFARIKNASTSEIIDEALVLYFKSPHSFTGEDVIEIHTHGSIAVIKELTSILNSMPLLRLAERGEFSKRAFENGKIDLTKAEGLADLIDSETSAQRKLSIEQLTGKHEAYYEECRKELIKILSQLEALIDYPDDDLPSGIMNSVTKKIAALRQKILAYLTQSNIGKLIRDGVEVAILGEPNVGKSSLLNALARKDIAIVSEIAGTTRDIVSAKIDLDGYLVNFYDTAGIRESADAIEKEGVRRALDLAESADLKIYVASRGSDLSSQLIEAADILIHNKSDLFTTSDPRFLNVSTLTGHNIDALLSSIKEFITAHLSQNEDPIMTRERYRKHFTCAAEYLEHFNPNQPLEISAEYVRLAASEIGKITGKVDVEEILDEIFSSFCIGK